MQFNFSMLEASQWLTSLAALPAAPPAHPQACHIPELLARVDLLSEHSRLQGGEVLHFSPGARRPVWGGDRWHPAQSLPCGCWRQCLAAGAKAPCLWLPVPTLSSCCAPPSAVYAATTLLTPAALCALLTLADTYVNEHTALCARLSAGACVDVATAVMRGEARAGVAVVRPPGHHAESNTAMGFCFFNNAGIAARAAQVLVVLCLPLSSTAVQVGTPPSYVTLSALCRAVQPPACIHSHHATIAPRHRCCGRLSMAQAAGAGRVLILDWDVHHGNGTRHIFEEDPSVLYMSLHRHDGCAQPAACCGPATRRYRRLEPYHAQQPVLLPLLLPLLWKSAQPHTACLNPHQLSLAPSLQRLVLPRHWRGARGGRGAGRRLHRQRALALRRHAQRRLPGRLPARGRAHRIW